MPSSLPSLRGLWLPLPGLMNSFLVPFGIVEHARVVVPTFYPALCDPFRLAFWTVGNPPFLVNPWSLALGY